MQLSYLRPTIRLVVATVIVWPCVSPGQTVRDDAKVVASISGKIVTPNGKPLRNADARVIFRSFRNTESKTFLVTTDNSGHFCLPLTELPRPNLFFVSAACDSFRPSVEEKLNANSLWNIEGDILFTLRRTPEELGRHAADARLSLKIETDKTDFRVGESVRIAARIRNLAANPVLIVGCLDGSTGKRRFPYWHLEVDGPDQMASESTGCFYMNSLNAHDFCEVKPSDELDPFGTVNDFAYMSSPTLRLQKPGTYKIRLIYDASSDILLDWLGWPQRDCKSERTDDLRPYVDAIPKLRLESNVVEVTAAADQ